MNLAVHFITFVCGLLLSLAVLLLQVLACQSYGLCSHVRYNFQTAPVYAPHPALVTMLPVLAVAALLWSISFFYRDLCMILITIGDDLWNYCLC
jgi:hypothetical protein